MTFTSSHKSESFTFPNGDILQWEMDDYGNHRLVKNGIVGETSAYQHPCSIENYVAFSAYYSENIPCEVPLSISKGCSQNENWADPNITVRDSESLLRWMRQQGPLSSFTTIQLADRLGYDLPRTASLLQNLFKRELVIKTFPFALGWPHWKIV